MLTVQVTSTYTSSERLINPEWTLAQLASKLEQITGVPPADQVIKVSGAARTFELKGHSTSLVSEFLPLESGLLTLQVLDSRPADAQFHLDESVEKYEMSDKEYEKRQNTVLEWKRQNKLGRFGDATSPEQPAESAPNVGPLGSRCIVAMKSGDRPAGTVCFVGKVAEIPGNSDWVGVALDSAVGKNDGSIGGHKYFECPASHGVFVKPSAISMLDDNLSDDEI